MPAGEKNIRKSEPAQLNSSHGKLTGLVYLLYFLIAILSQVFQKHQILYLSLNLIANIFYIILSILFYFLFKPVNRNLSLVAATFSILGCIVGSLELFHIDLHEINPLLFFGPYCILIGWLVWRSDFLPGLLGLLMIAAGFGWLFSILPQAKNFSMYIQIVGILAEGILMLWLLIRGVDEKRWIASAEAMRTFS